MYYMENNLREVELAKYQFFIIYSLYTFFSFVCIHEKKKLKFIFMFSYKFFCL